MSDPEHVLAAREHADRAKREGRQGDPAVLVGLAQTEALLAVAAAIDRLTAMLSERHLPSPSSAPGQKYRVTEVRRNFPNAYAPGTPEADAALLAAHRAGHDVATLADTFGRQPSAIRSRLNRLDPTGSKPADTGDYRDEESGTTRP